MSDNNNKSGAVTKGQLRTTRVESHAIDKNSGPSSAIYDHNPTYTKPRDGGLFRQKFAETAPNNTKLGSSKSDKNNYRGAKTSSDISMKSGVGNPKQDKNSYRGPRHSKS